MHRDRRVAEHRLRARRRDRDMTLPVRERVADVPEVAVGLDLEGHVGEVIRPLPQLPDVEVTAIAHPDTAVVARLSQRVRQRMRA